MKKKLLIINKFFSENYGGAENVVFNITQKLKDRYDITVVCSNYVKYKPIKGVKIVSFPVTFKLKSYVYSKRLKSYLEKEIKNFDLIHCHNYRCFYVDTAVRIARRNNVPVILTNHGIFDSQNIFFEFLMRIYNKTIGKKTLELVDVVHSVSKSSEVRIKKISNNIKKFIVIYNGVDLSIFLKDKKKIIFKKKFNIEYKKTILFLGRVVKDKGLDILLNTYKSSLYKHCNLFVVGDYKNDYGLRLRREIVSSGLDKKVIFLGLLKREDVSQIMSEVDCFVLPSRYEPFGLVLVEAMASGLPVVAFDVGGAREVIKGTGNYLVKPLDQILLAQSIIKSLKNKTLRKENKVTSQRFSIETFIKNIDSLYLEQINKQK